MGDARSQEERLPWLDAPRPAATRPPAKKPPPKAARRARGPIFVLLALFLMTGVGMIAYLAGRGSVAPIEIPASESPPSPRRATVSLPAPPPLEPPPAVVSEIRTAEPARAAPQRTVVDRRAAPRPDRRVARATSERRTVRIAKAEPRRAAPPRRVAPPPRYVIASNVVQLGVYRNRRSAYAAYRRLAKVYPYLGKLPRMVRRTTAPAGSAAPRTYRLQMRTYSPEHARILCGNLRSIGRGCVVLPQGR